MDLLSSVNYIAVFVMIIILGFISYEWYLQQKLRKQEDFNDIPKFNYDEYKVNDLTSIDEIESTTEAKQGMNKIHVDITSNSNHPIVSVQPSSFIINKENNDQAKKNELKVDNIVNNKNVPHPVTFIESKNHDFTELSKTELENINMFDVDNKIKFSQEKISQKKVLSSKIPVFFVSGLLILLCIGSLFYFANFSKKQSALEKNITQNISSKSTNNSVNLIKNKSSIALNQASKSTLSIANNSASSIKQSQSTFSSKFSSLSTNSNFVSSQNAINNVKSSQNITKSISSLNLSSYSSKSQTISYSSKNSSSAVSIGSTLPVAGNILPIVASGLAFLLILVAFAL